MSRSSLPEVRNPILALPGAARFADLSPEARAALRGVLVDLSSDAASRAQAAWRKHKAPMALYWKAVSVYARHLAPAIPAPSVSEGR